MLDKMEYERSAILKRVQENRDKHVKDYELALEAYRLEVLEQLSKIYHDVHEVFLKVTNEGIDNFGSKYNDGQFEVDAEKPEDHRNDYEQVIDMLEMATADKIELDRSEFTQYVRDEWKWTKQFYASTSSLIAKHNLQK